jgi:hypothetical protein
MSTYRIHIKSLIHLKDEAYYAVQWLRGIGIKFDAKQHVKMHDHTHAYIDWIIPEELNLAQQQMFVLLFYSQRVEKVENAS